MRTTTLLLAFTSTTFAFDLLKRNNNFQPEVTTAEGATCADAFGPGYETCRNGTETVNRLCFDASLGQVCCDDQWACPVGSQCGLNGSCCQGSSCPNSTVASSSVSATATGVRAASLTSAAAAASTESQKGAASKQQVEQLTLLIGAGLVAGAMALL